MREPAQRLCDFLVSDMEATEDTAYATDLLTKAKAQIAAGEGEIAMLAEGSMNGKSFARAAGLQLNLTALDVAQAARTALNIYAGTANTSPFTFLDFRRAFPQ